MFCSCSNRQVSSKRLDSIADYHREGLNLRVECRNCRRVVVLDAGRVLMTCHRRGQSKQIDQVAARLRCGDCGARDVYFGPI